MSYAPVQAFSVGIASLVTLSSALDLSKSYRLASIVIPTMTSGTDVYIQGSDTLAGTYRRIYQMGATSVATAVFVASTVTKCVVGLPIGCQFVKIELSTAMTATSAQFQILISD